MAQLFVGVDGGGTKCRMRLCDAELNTLGEAVTERPSNLQVRNGDAAFEAIAELTEKVCIASDISIGQMRDAYACFGMAGGRLETARSGFEKRTFPFAGVKVFDDIDIALAGAHGDADGGVVIIGTGSAAMAMVEGQRHQIGGWGFHVGDTMSGAILGRELLRRSLLAHDGLISGSPLTRAVMEQFSNRGDVMMDWSFDNPGAIAALTKTLPEGVEPTHNVPARPGDYGTFARMVVEYFRKGDAVANDLVEFELSAIAEYVDWFTSIGVKRLAIVGGLGHSLMPEIRSRFGEMIVHTEPDSLYGACFMARRLFGETA